jgi:hypothetical protein
LYVDASLHDFDRSHFWTDISNLKFGRKPTTNEIHHPTLRFMHKWLATTIFPKEELGTVRNEEMKLLYAMIKKKRKLVTCQINVALLDNYSCHEEVQNSIYIMGHTNC